MTVHEIKFFCGTTDQLGSGPSRLEVSGSHSIRYTHIHTHTHTHTHTQPQPVKEWPHLAMRPTCMEPQESTRYSKVIFTDGSKTDDKVGAGVAVYAEQDLIKWCKYKLGSCCTNNQAE
jgi:hypothetical protein